MQNSEIIQHPIIMVSIGGVVVEKRPVAFKLSTLAGCAATSASLLYPADSDAGKVGESIAVSLSQNEKTDLYFTGAVYETSVHGAYRELIIADGYRKLFHTEFTAAYRKEKASSILDDILSAAGITEKKTACPDVELSRFSTQSVSARRCIDLLIGALSEHGAEGLAYFFDEKDVFHFGTKNDAGKNEGEVFNFESAKDILKRGAGKIEVYAKNYDRRQRGGNGAHSFKGTSKNFSF